MWKEGNVALQPTFYYPKCAIESACALKTHLHFMVYSRIEPTGVLIRCSQYPTFANPEGNKNFFSDLKFVIRILHSPF